jgi:hypothetical protein
MPVNRTQTLLGRYAIYYRQLSDFIRERQRAYFGRSTTPPSPTPVATTEQQIVQHELSSPPNDTDAGKQAVDELEKLVDVVNTSLPVLMKSKAVFPFDLFPDTITIDRHKFTLVHRTFFFIQQTIGVKLSDINNVEGNIGPFFGSLVITSQHFKNNIQHINFLPRKDVIDMQQVLQGVIIANQEGVDFSAIDDEELIALLRKLGQGETNKTSDLN